MQDGYIYSNLLLKLYLRSLQDNGRLMFNDVIPYSAQMIAAITRHQVGTVEKALKIFQQMGLIEILDSGAIYMLNIQNYIGESTTEADRKKEYRARIDSEKNHQFLLSDKSLDKCPTNVQQKPGQMSNKYLDKRTPEIEIELEKEINIDI